MHRATAAVRERDPGDGGEPSPWRRRLAQDGALFGVLTRLFVESVERFYEERAARRGACGAVKSGAVTVVQRTSGDMRLNPHLHVVFLDGAYHEDGTELVWNELGHLRTREAGQVLEHAAAALSHRQVRWRARVGESPTLARKRIGPRPAKPEEPTKADDDAAPKRKRGGYRAVDKPRRALAPHICDRCPRVPSLQGADEARRRGDRGKEHRPLPLRDRRADRCSSTLSQRPRGGRRTGRAPFCAASLASPGSTSPSASDRR
ncbi:transposase [Sorangium sp. So ce291]|uniref:transposase n=1 Tax=Sorangium sp. So ce291 TaxID=3133294 RepID=UPI003F631556